VLSAQSLQRRDDFFLALLDSVGDHTRGLFEAEASIAMSTTHPFKNVDILIFASHGIFLNWKLRKNQLSVS